MAKNKKESNKKTKNPPAGTWVEMTYNLSAVVRVSQKILNGAHPASYFKMAKDRIGMPLLEKYTSETVQNIAFLTSEVVECVISPPVYAVNKATAIVANLSGSAIKDRLNIRHPELRAIVDVTCKEAAHQATHQFIKVSKTPKEGFRFFKSAHQEALHRPITEHGAKIQSKL